VGTTETAFKPRSGLLTALDVIIAPQAAFARIAVAPTWIWGFLIAAAAAVIYSILALPALIHVFDTSLPPILAKSPQISALPAAEQQKQIARILGFYHFIAKLSWIIQPITILVIGLVQTVVLLVTNIAAKGKADFRRLWALTMNVAVVGYGITFLVILLVVLVRGPESFDTINSLTNAVPGLGLLAPPGQPALDAFLTAFNVTNIWASILFVAGMRTIAKIRLTPAIVAAAIMLFGLAIIGAGQAAQAH
jgi:hypothetical protein